MRILFFLVVLVWDAFGATNYLNGTASIGGVWNSGMFSGGGGGGNIASGLTTWWKYDDGSGTVLTDSSGNAHHGSIVTGTAWVSGQFNTALLFVSGSSQKVNCGDVGLSSLAASSMSVWIKRASVNAVVPVGHIISGTKGYYIYAFGDGNFYVGLYNGAVTYATFASNDTSWHHIVMVFDGGLSGDSNRLKVWLDGAQLSGASTPALTITGPIPSTTSSGMTDFQIGHGEGDSIYGNGSVDATRIYNRALIPAEATALFTTQ